MAPHPLPHKSEARTPLFSWMWQPAHPLRKEVFVLFRSRISTQMLTRMALLMALNIILTRWLSVRIPIGGVEGIRIGFGELPVVFAGIFMGPLAGGLVGAVGDMVGYFINPIGAYMPHFTLTAALRGIIPGLFILLVTLGGRREVGIFPLFLAVCITTVVVNIFMVPYFIETLFGLSRVVTVPPRIISSVIGIPAFTVMLFYLGRTMEKVLAPVHGKEALHLSGKIW